MIDERFTAACLAVIVIATIAQQINSNLATSTVTTARYTAILALVGASVWSKGFLPARLYHILTGLEPFTGIAVTKDASFFSGHSSLFARNFRDTWMALTVCCNDDGFSSCWMGWKPVCVVNNVKHAQAILVS